MALPIQYCGKKKYQICMWFYYDVWRAFPNSIFKAHLSWSYLCKYHGDKWLFTFFLSSHICISLPWLQSTRTGTPRYYWYDFHTMCSIEPFIGGGKQSRPLDPSSYARRTEKCCMRRGFVNQPSLIFY
jgi:hypothetical protein